MGVYIYGAGRVGRLMEELLVKNGYFVDAFIDINAENLQYKDYKIIKHDEINISKNAEIIVALAGENAANYAKSFLEKAGYQEVILYSDKKMQDELCLRKTGGGCAQCVFAANCKLKMENTQKICLNSLFLSLTTRCSLNCKHCLALVPKAKREKVIKDMNAQNFEKALNVLEKYIEEIKEYSIAGGEPLLNKDICTILKTILNSKIKFEVINILTNGTVPIPEELMSLLHNKKIKITIDDYGNKLTEKKRDLITANIKNLRKNNFNYAIIDNSNGTWYDYGGFENRHLSESEIEERFGTCVTGDCIGLSVECYLGRCGRHMSMVSVLGGISGDKEYIDLLNDTEDVRDKLTQIVDAKTLTTCNYCNGFGIDNIVSAGEQE